MDNYNKDNLDFARKNRRQRNATRQEGILWHTYLKSCPVNFCRQYRVGNYILDFYAPSIKLAIELDGSQHFEPKGLSYDAERTALLESKGIEVMRFSNQDIDMKLRECQVMIAYRIAQKTGAAD